MRCLPLLSLLCLSLPCTAWAAEPDCFGLLADHTPPLSLRAGTIVGSGKAFFLSDIGTACAATDGACRAHRSPYVLPGDRLAVIGTAPGYVCVSYPPAHGFGDVSGWLPVDRVQEDNAGPKQGSDAALLGTWRIGKEQSITIRHAAQDGFSVEGSAIWRGGIAVHLGTISGPLAVQASTARYADGTSDESCVVVMRRIGDRLAVIDNAQCGGLNVTFGGWYHKQ